MFNSRRLARIEFKIDAIITYLNLVPPDEVKLRQLTKSLKTSSDALKKVVEENQPKGGGICGTGN